MLNNPAMRPNVLALPARWWPGLLAGALWLGLCLGLSGIPVSHDVVWQMWIARQLSHGAVFGRDIIEINPPLWFWMALPVEWAARLLDVSPLRAIVAAVFLQMGAALLLVARLMANEAPKRRAAASLGALGAMAIVPIPDFAQREHLALIGAIPYALLVARRAEGRPVAWGPALAVGALAAPGFALKHYFVLVPLLLETWLFWRRQSAWTPFRPETLVLGLAALAYGAAVLVFAPDFLAVVAPMVAAAYDGYEAPLWHQVARPWVALWLIAALALWRERQSSSPLTAAAALAALGFGLAYLLQGKGWSYHAMPATGLLFFACAAMLPALGRHWRTRPLAPGAALALAVYSLAVGSYANLRAPHAEALLRSTAPGSAVVMLTANPSNIWPVVETMGFVWPSRHFTFWMLHAIARAERRDGTLPANLAAMAREVRRQTVHDLSCNPPQVILVDSFAGSRSPGFDAIAFFERDEAFRRMFANYGREGENGPYTAYRKRTGWEPPKPGGCRTIH